MGYSLGPWVRIGCSSTVTSPPESSRKIEMSAPPHRDTSATATPLGDPSAPRSTVDVTTSSCCVEGSGA
jgi:hypothetical protein